MPCSRLVIISFFFSLASWVSSALLAASNEINSPNTTGVAARATAAGPLDGLSFRGAVGPDGKPKDIPDLFFFANGSFLSRECEFRCEYPAGPYFVRQIGSKTEFISEIKYPYRDAKIVWRGTIEGDKITGKSTWIVKRWYWTVENTFEFEGKLQKEPLTTASTD